MITYDNILKLATGEGVDHTTVCLLDYDYFKIYYKMIPIEISKQQALDADPKAIEQIDFTEDLEQQAAIFLIIGEAKGAVLYFTQATVKVL